MNYREIAPRPELSPYVKCFWTLAGPGGGVERVLPDGCTEIVLNRAAPFRGHRADGTTRLQPRVMIVGQIRRFIRIEPTGPVDLVGIRFRPGGLFPFLGADQADLRGQRVEVGQVDRRLHRRLEAAEDLARVEAILLDRLRPPCGRVAAAVARIERARGGLRIDALAQDVGIGARGLERLFRRQVGLSPKGLSRILRFQAVVAGVERTARMDWAAAALANGYYDQAHLINEFRGFAGVSPGAYFATEHPLNDFFTGRSDSSNPGR